MTAKANLAASVAARLLNRAKETGDDYQILRVLDAFLSPLLEDLRNRETPAGKWRPGGPWR